MKRTVYIPTGSDNRVLKKDEERACSKLNYPNYAESTQTKGRKLSFSWRLQSLDGEQAMDKLVAAFLFERLGGFGVQ